MKTDNYNATFKFIGQMALTHLVLLLLTNSIAKWKNCSSLQSPSSKTVNISQHLNFPFHSPSFETNCMLIQMVDSSSEKSAGTTSSAKCSLCWDSRKDTSCTPCGHLFCWHCILQWLQTKHECPLCRESVQPSRIVPLFNYE